MRLRPLSALFWLVLLANLLFMPGGVGGDGYTSFLAANSIVTHGTLSLDVTASDADTINMVYHNPRDGKYYCLFGFLWTAVMIPGVASGRWLAPLLGSAGALVPAFFVSMLNPLFTALGAWLLAALLAALGVPLHRAVLLGLAYAFATFAWPYAQSTFSDPLLVACFLAAALALVRATRTPAPQRAWWMAAAGGALGASLLTKFYAGIFIPVFAGYALLALRREGRSWRELIADLCPAAAALAAAAAVWMWYNCVQFGGPFSYGYPPDPTRFQAPWQGLWGLAASPGRSLFLYAPVTLLVLWVLPKARRVAPLEAGWFLAILAAHAALFTPLRYWHAGVSWGPRYLLPALPFMLALLALGWPTGISWFRRAATALAVIGLLIQMPAVAAPWFLWDGAARQAGAPEAQLLWRPDLSLAWGAWRVAGAVLARRAGVVPPPPRVAGIAPLDLSGADHWTSWLARLAGGSFTTVSGRTLLLPPMAAVGAALLLAGGLGACGWLALCTLGAGSPSRRIEQG